MEMSLKQFGRPLPGFDDNDRGSLSSWSTSPAGTASNALSGGAVRGSSSRASQSSRRYSEPSQTLIFLDWDDTLFPTSALLERWGLPAWIDGCEKQSWKGKAKHDASLPEELHKPLEAWREALFQLLFTASALSDRCVIVTNATRPWVDGCINRFAPNLWPLFNREVGGLKVVYADEALRSSQEERAGPQASEGCCWSFLRTQRGRHKRDRGVDFTAGKSAAMRREAVSFYSQYPGQTWKNVLSMGDMRYERDAVKKLPAHRGELPGERLRIKALTHPDRPGLRELTLALHLSRVLLRLYVSHDGNLDLDLRALPKWLQHVGEGLQLPAFTALDSLLQKSLLNMEDDEVFEELLDEVFLIAHDVTD